MSVTLDKSDVQVDLHVQVDLRGFGGQRRDRQAGDRAYQNNGVADPALWLVRRLGAAVRTF
jgi:hypothetical protein